MSIPVKLKDIIEALGMTTDSITYSLDKRTGQIEMISEDVTVGMDLEDDPLVDLVVRAKTDTPDDYFTILSSSSSGTMRPRSGN